MGLMRFPFLGSAFTGCGVVTEREIDRARKDVMRHPQ